MSIPLEARIATDRFVLRSPSEDDIPYIFSASRVEGFNDGMGWDPLDKMEDHYESFQRSLAKWKNGEGYSFSIDDKAGTFLGRISIRRTDKDHIWNIGFWTHPTYQRNGVMTECVAVIIRIGFLKLNASRIEADHAVWNMASKKVLESNGFTFVERNEKGLLKNGKWIAENKLSIQRSVWEQGNQI